MKYILSTFITLLILQATSKAQLTIQNASFEANNIGSTDLVPPPANWNNCICCIDTSIIDLISKNSTLDIYDTSFTTPPIEGNSYIGLSGLYYWYSPSGIHNFNVGGEMCSGSIACQKNIFKGHQYKLSFSAFSIWDDLINPPPQLSVYMGENVCDTTQRIFLSLINHDTLSVSNPNPTWKTYSTSFISKGDWRTISLRSENIFKDTSKKWGKGNAYTYIDHLSQLIPDTAYNSLRFPIKQVCDGSQIFLQSPYPFEDDQRWYIDTVLVGSGYGIYVSPSNPTVYTLVVGRDSCIPSVIQALVYPSCENELVFPTAFTPNSDDQNEVFRPIQNIAIHQINNFELLIFNRRGNKIFTTNDYKTGWNGGDYPMDTYFYLATYNAYNGKLKRKKGTVTLIR